MTESTAAIKRLVQSPDWKIYQEMVRINREVWLYKLKTCKKEEPALKWAGFIHGFDECRELADSIIQEEQMKLKKEKDRGEMEEEFVS